MRRSLIICLVLLTACSSIKEKPQIIEKQVVNNNTPFFNNRDVDYNFTNYSFSDNHSLKNHNEHFFKGNKNSYLKNIINTLKEETMYSLEFELENIDDLNLIIKSDDDEIISQNIKQDGIYYYEFTNKSGDLSLEFNFISNNSIIKNIKFRNLENSDYQLRVNQLGYIENESKLFNSPKYVGDYYEIYNLDNQLVYKGNFVHHGFSELAGEDIFEADFKALKTEGIYYIVSELGYRSYEFKISKDIYQQLTKESLKMIKAQRCGCELLESEFGELAHPACHQNEAILHESLLYDYRHHLDITGGWHDAGDYGRYSQTINKVLNDLLLSYFMGNQDSALVDEIKWGTDFLLKMQDDSGGIYLKAVSEKFAPMIYPEDDQSTIYVLNRSTNVSANAVMIFNLASIVFKDNQDYSNTLKQAAKKAYDYMTNNVYREIKNPEHFNAGYYKEDYDQDERYNANASMYLIYQEDIYLQKIEKLLDENYGLFTSGFNYDNSDAYGSFIMLFLNKKHRLYHKIESMFLEDVLSIYQNSLKNPYLISNTNLVWGSNYRLLDDGKKMFLAYKLNGNQDLKLLALNTIDYVLGKNPLNQSYITGYGSNYPINIHHRITIRNPKAYLNAALVGGPDAYLEDPITQSIFDLNVPELKRYVDDSGSYSTNEVAVYYNSALYSLLSIIK